MDNWIDRFQNQIDRTREKETNEMAQMLNCKEEINTDEIRKVIRKIKKNSRRG